MTDNTKEYKVELAPFPSTIYGAPPCYDLDELSADIAFLGFPYELGKGQTLHGSEKWGPKAIRNQRRLYMYSGHQHPPLPGEEGAQGWFDLDSEEWQMRGVTMADCGDVVLTPEGGESTSAKVMNTDRLTAAVKKILERKSFPMLIGGDHTLTTPAVRAFKDFGPLDIVFFDAHLDWYDEYHGAKVTDADNMTRCAELPFVNSITQIGMAPYNRLHKGDDYGQYVKAKEHGAKIITADKVRKIGVQETIESIPKAENIYVTIDIDCMDAAYVPGCSAMTVGGLSYLEVRDIVRGIPSRGKVVGFDVNDLQPARDPINRSAKLVGTLILDLLAAIFPGKK